MNAEDKIYKRGDVLPTTGKKGFRCGSLCEGDYDMCTVKAREIPEKFRCLQKKIICRQNCLKDKILFKKLRLNI